MSGGTYNINYRLEEFYIELSKNSVEAEGKAATLRQAFLNHLTEVIEVIRILDYVDSGDMSEESEIEPLIKLLGKKAELTQLKKEAEEVLTKLQEALKINEHTTTKRNHWGNPSRNKI